MLADEAGRALEGTRGTCDDRLTGEVPLEVAAKQLQKDGVTILHTIGGDDTNTQAAQVAKYLAENNYKITVVGLPKTIDNDVVPIRQSLGAWTAAATGKSSPALLAADSPRQHWHRWAAPELARGDAWTDAGQSWALGRVLWELLAPAPPRLPYPDAASQEPPTKTEVAAWQAQWPPALPASARLGLRRMTELPCWLSMG